MSRLILASGSATRARLLRAAGLDPVIDPARIDEDEIKLACRAEGFRVEEVAEALAETKARRIAHRHGGQDFILGADQMLDLEGDWLDKPADIAAARAQLLRLRGRTHRLVSCAVLFRGTQRVWHHVASASLSVRPFTEAFLDGYLEQVGEAALSSVGAYQLEGPGVQLFSRIEGDYFTILGLPLLPLLDFLRTHEVLQG